MANETGIVTSKDGNSFLMVITLQTPIPDLSGLSDFSITFPPGIPLVTLPVLPPALLRLAQQLEGLVATVNKLIELIPDATVQLKIKAGDTVIFDQKLTI